MNSKRQTIWLVSMLGLMVVLSAYYLFTDNAGELETAGDGNAPGGTAIESLEVGDRTDVPDLGELAGAPEEWTVSGLWDEEWAADEHGHGEEETAPGSGESPAADHGGHGSPETQAAGDEAILERVRNGARSGEEYIAALEMERMNALSREIEELFNVALDQTRSPEEVAKADERLRMIEETQAIVDDLEGRLLQQFENVVITEANGKWNVVVKADKLERSQVVTIIDMVMEGLNVSAGDVVVERVG